MTSTAKTYARSSVLIAGRQYDRGDEIPAEALDAEGKAPTPRETLESGEQVTTDSSEFKAEDTGPEGEPTVTITQAEYDELKALEAMVDEEQAEEKSSGKGPTPPGPKPSTPSK